MALKKVEEVKDLEVGSQLEDNQSVSKEEVTVSTVEEEELAAVVESEVVVKNGISPEELDVILANQRELLQKEFRQMMKSEMQISKNKSEIDDSISDGEDLLEDWIENPVTFFSYSLTYALFSDMRMGRESSAPLGMVRFKPLIRRKVMSQRGVTTTSVCVAKSNSKKEVNWLRSSPLFGITFHESIKGTTSVDASWAQILIASNQEVNKLNEHSVITKSRAYGLDLSSDIGLMRKNLTDHLAKMKKASSDLYYQRQAKQMSEMTENPETGKLGTLIQK